MSLLTGVHAIETRAASADNSKLGAYGRGVVSTGIPVKTNHFSGDQTMQIYMVNLKYYPYNDPLFGLGYARDDPKMFILDFLPSENFTKFQ